MLDDMWTSDAQPPRLLTILLALEPLGGHLCQRNSVRALAKPLHERFVYPLPSQPYLRLFLHARFALQVRPCLVETDCMWRKQSLPILAENNVLRIHFFGKLANIGQGGKGVRAQVTNRLLNGGQVLDDLQGAKRDAKVRQAAFSSWTYCPTLSSCFALSCLFERLRCEGRGVNGTGALECASRGREDDVLVSPVRLDEPLFDDDMARRECVRRGAPVGSHAAC